MPICLNLQVLKKKPQEGVIKLSNLLFILFWIVSIVVGVLLIITKKKQYLVAYIIASAILYVILWSISS